MTVTPRAYRRDIQGLRAIAILSVVIFHAFPKILPGGFVGVDVFFVISGYLITGTLLKELRAGQFSISGFYVRRARRLFPALIVVISFCLIAGYFVLTPPEFEELGRTVVTTALFVSNFDFWSLTGYFARDASLKPLLHTWSLAIEEQFYLFYPLLLHALWRHAPRRFVGLLVGLLFVSLALGVGLGRVAPVAAYFVSPARAFEFLIGVVIASTALPLDRTPFTRAITSLAGFACIGAQLFLYSSESPLAGLASILPCVGTALVIVAGQEAASLGGNLISSYPFQFFGNLSYSLYLWHWPLLAFARNFFEDHFDAPIAGATMGLAIVLAVLTYRCIERPFLDRRLDELPYLRLGASAVALLSAAGATVFALQGIPARYSPEARAMFAYGNDFNPRRDSCHTDGHMSYKRNCIFGAERTPPDLAVWADSHGAEIVVALGNRAQVLGRSVMQITASGCPPALDFVVRTALRCREHNRKTLNSLVDDVHIKAVVLAAYVTGYSETAALKLGLEETVRALTQSGKRTILLLPIPTMVSDPPFQVGRDVEWQRDPTALGLARADYDAKTDVWRAFLVELSRRYKAEVFDPATALCDTAVCHIFDSSAGVLYFNSEHLSLSGAKLVVRNLADSLYGRE